MVDSHKPRHIRDIAHLYISRLQNQSRAPCVALIIAGERRCCFPGFHTANLAAAFVSKGVTARITELSNLLPNAGFYMSLPARRYIQWDDGENGSVFSGLAGVKVGFSLRSPFGLESTSRRPRIELFHLPPISRRERFDESLEKVRDSIEIPAAAVLLSKGDNRLQETMSTVEEQLAPWPVYHLNLDRGFPHDYSGNCRLSDLGSLPVWERALIDRVPAVVRVPGSALSRAYLSICDSLLCRIQQLRRKSIAVPAFSVSPGIRSRRDDQ